uniref:Uncharacterized protein n=1 Tax=Bartonella rochalimae ATCC BAA-1498 TaxID=685782 RepID=E6YL54_9HYPH|nr:hypothetical protein BARRO_30173 [Bartonella rochalimae ATCC BAA-1498]
MFLSTIGEHGLNLFSYVSIKQVYIKPVELDIIYFDFCLRLIMAILDSFYENSKI